MRRIALFALVMFVAIVGQDNASGGQQQTSAGMSADAAIALAADDRPTGQRMVPFPSQPTRPRMTSFPERPVSSGSSRYYRGGARECPGYTKSRRARLRVNRTVERLLARGYDDPLSQPAYLRAARAERALAPAVDACNMAWLRHVSIYGSKRRY